MSKQNRAGEGQGSMAVLRIIRQRVFRQIPFAWRYRLYALYLRFVERGGLSAAQRAEVVRALGGQAQGGGRRRVWFLPSVTWYSAGFQRPQQMALALAETGCEVVYWEAWQVQAAVRTARSDHERDFVGLKTVAPNLQLLRCPSWKYYMLLNECRPDWLLFFWPSQAAMLRRGRPGRMIYEMIDDHSLDGVGEQWGKEHEKLLVAADIVTASADALLAQVQQVRPDALLLPNGVRLEDWAGVGQAAVPPDMEKACQKAVVVGYYGAIAAWMDFDLWMAAARLRPDWAFVWIGFPYTPETMRKIEQVTALPNAFYLGGKSYGELPAYLAHFDVAAIPFVLNSITHACSPVKLFEFMAAGKPVVATRMREILKYHSVRFAGTAEEFVAEIESALQQRNDPNYQRRLRAEAEANTWRARAAMLCRAMEVKENNPLQARNAT
jgi:glycosyltransferase involved in cell wall biosynthesis